MQKLINLSKIQHFSVGDGDGIRTTVFLKGCNLRCPWCHNPENLSGEPVTLRYKTTGLCETLGKRTTVEELMPELLEDLDFYKESGGGVTFSGGEAMLQAEKLVPLAEQLRKEGVSVLIDTAGCVPYSSFEVLHGRIDGYLFDFKTADATKYKEIGGNLSLVTENIRRLIADGEQVEIRIPLIPCFNTDENSIADICSALTTIGIKNVTLLPFHRLGGSKYEAMGLKYVYADQQPIPHDQLNAIKAQFEKHFKVKIDG